MPAYCRSFKGGIIVVASILAGCVSTALPDLGTDSVNLHIADRGWDPNRPDRSVGWCAEACIQMAMGYYGKEVSQITINQAGHPAQSDLWENDINPALDALGVNYLAWDENNYDLTAFIEWIREQIKAGYPVICGVKIYPDEEPTWYVDHFMLAVGYDATGFLMNTNYEGQEHVSYSQLLSYNEGFSFKNRYSKSFARAITGLR